MNPMKPMKMVPFIRLLILAVLTGAAIAACQRRTHDGAVDPTHSSSSVLADCRTILHELGETDVCGQPQKIVALGPYMLEYLLALDIQPAGFADFFMFHHGDYDNPSQQIPFLGKRVTSQPANVGGAYSPSIEAILKVQPDLIVGTAENATQYDTLSEIAPTLLLEWGDPKGSLGAIAQAVDRTEQAERVWVDTEQQITTARQRFAPRVATHPQVLLLSASRLREINLGNSGHGHCSSLIEALGFQLIAPPGFDRSNADPLLSISLETLPQLNDADLVILLGSNFNELKQLDGTNNFETHQLAQLKQAWQENAIAQSLDASQSGQVYFIPAYLCLGLPGPLGAELYLKELQTQLLPNG